MEKLMEKIIEAIEEAGINISFGEIELMVNAVEIPVKFEGKELMLQLYDPRA